MSEEKRQFGQKLTNFATAYVLPVAGVLVIVVSIFSYIFILKPKYDSVIISINSVKKDIQENIDEQKKFLSKLKKNIEELANIDQHNLNKLTEIFPKSLDIARVISILNVISKENGFVLEDIKYFDASEDKKSSSNIKTTNLLITISGGGYGELKSFLQMASDSARIIDVTSVGFDGSRTYNIELRVYCADGEILKAGGNFADLEMGIFKRKSFLRLRQYATPVLAESIDALADNENIPPPISDLVINDPGIGDRLDLFWVNAKSDLASKIKIYRFDGEAIKGELVVELDKDSAAFTDKGLVTDKSYYYLVKTASQKNIESINTQKYQGIPTNIVPPLEPYGIKVSSSGTIMGLSWTNPECYDLAYVYIYKSKIADLLGELTAKIPAYSGKRQSWEDNAVENFTKYYYTLVAEDTAGNRSPDKVIKFSGGDLFELKEK